MKTWGGIRISQFFSFIIPAVAVLACFVSSNAHAAGPSITTQPQDQSAIAGSNAVFTVVASGQTPLFYQWSFNGTNLVDSAHLSGVTNATLTVSNVLAGDAGNYQVVVSNSHGSVMSSNAVLTVLFPPSITSQPTYQTVVESNNVTFTVTALGTGPLSYWWYYNDLYNGNVLLINGGRVSGADSATLTISNVQAGDYGLYQVVVTNNYGMVTSSAVVLNVRLPPTMGVQPYDQYRLLGDSVTFYADGNGSPTIVYQWQKDGTNLVDNARVSGSTSTTLTITNLQMGDIGAYQLILTNPYGTTASMMANLSVVPIAAWGVTGLGQANVPLTLTDVVAVAAAPYDNFALGIHGLVEEWGDYPLYAPTGFSNIVAVTADLALKNDGTIMAWGDNSAGQTNLPSGLSNVVAISEGSVGSCLALRNDGTVVGWGNNYNGQAAIPAGLGNVIAIAAGLFHSLALKDDGTVVGWGRISVPPGLSNIVAISAGDDYSLFLRNDGTVMSWGDNSFGQTNVPDGLSNVVAIAGSYTHSLALKNDGTVVAWGDNTYGETNVPVNLQDVVAIAASENHNLALVENPVARVPPTIWWQPSNRTFHAARTGMFIAQVNGSLPMRYQWYFDGTALAGETNKWLALSSLQLAQAGTYQYVAANNYGSVTSQVATVTESPSIVVQPPSQSSGQGSNMVFSAAAFGPGSLGYEWLFNGTPLTDGARISGSTTTNLTIADLQAGDAGSYQLVVTNNYGADTSAVAVLTVLLPPTIVTAPTNQVALQGGTAVFQVVASGTAPLSYQWQRSGTNLVNGGRYSGVNSSTFQISSILYNDPDNYEVVVSNAYGQATSPPATLSLVYAPYTLLGVQPGSQSVPLNGTATFTVDLGGTPPLYLQWLKNGTNIPNDGRINPTNYSLVIPSVLPGDAGTYTVSVSNAYGSVVIGSYSGPGSLTVLYPPSITFQPQNQSAVAGSNATFDVFADSPNGALTYQWYFNGTNIPWAKTFELTLTNVQSANMGSYGVIVGNPGGSVTSSVAQLAVVPSAPWFASPLQSQNDYIGTTVTFNPQAFGSQPLSFQWEFNGTNLPGATSATLSIPNAQTNNSGTYSVIATNDYGSATSAVVTLIVQNPLLVTGQSGSKAALLGSNVSFAVTVSGTAPQYQWYFNGTSLSDDARINGSATATLTISNVQTSDAGAYMLVVTNLLSAARSLPASLTPLTVPGASVRYVSTNNVSPASPYLDWSTAATNIQDAVDAAVDGDSILVSNGVYQGGWRAVYGANNRVVVNKAVALQGVNGPGNTTILGDSSTGRCVYLTNGASLLGFTLSRGATTYYFGDGVLVKSGAGVWCESSDAIISNCVLIGNYALSNGGGAFRGRLFNCLLACNYAAFGGGAASNILVNCVVVSNNAQGFTADYGGGVMGCTLSNCQIVGNHSSSGGGGAAFSTLTGCVVSNNVASGNGAGLYYGTATSSFIYGNRTSGGSGGGAFSNILNNCVVADNAAYHSPGAFQSTLVNCTVVENNLGSYPAIEGGNLTNCIVYYNGGPLNYGSYLSTPHFVNCDTTPLPPGRGNITNTPLFVNSAGGDFHLQSNSPCINSGNNAYVTVTNDLDGNPRIVGGTVDMGAYEYQTPVSTISYAWLQQYGLPIGTNTDTTDADGTGMNNWQKWIAGLNPTNPASVLAMSPSVLAANSTGIAVSWQSVSNRTYYLQRATDLTAQSAFSAIYSNILGQAGTTSFTDTTATNGGPYFYRVGVQY